MDWQQYRAPGEQASTKAQDDSWVFSLAEFIPDSQDEDQELQPEPNPFAGLTRELWRAAHPAAGPAPAGAAVPTPPPDGNTGGKLNTCVDMLRMTLPRWRMSEVRHMVTYLLGQPRLADFGAQGYARSWRWESGASLSFHRDRYEALLVLGGSDLGELSPAVLVKLLQLLRPICIHLTRIDFACDDRTGELLHVEEFRQAGRAGNVIGPKVFESRQPIKRGVLLGDSATFGRRGDCGGGTYVRVYDKALEQKTEGPWVRYEVEFSQEKAHLLGESLLDVDDVESLERLVRRVLRGAIDFRDRSVKHYGQVARMPRLDWWQDVVDSLSDDEVKIRPVRHRPPLQRSLLAAKKQLSRIMAKGIQVGQQMGVNLKGVFEAWWDEAADRAREWRLGAESLGLDVAELLGRPVPPDLLVT